MTTTLAEAINSALNNNSTPEEVEACRGVEDCQAISGPEMDVILPMLPPQTDADRQALDSWLDLSKTEKGSVRLTGSARKVLFSSLQLKSHYPIWYGEGTDLPAFSRPTRVPPLPIIDRFSYHTHRNRMPLSPTTNPVEYCRAAARLPVATIQESGTLKSGRPYETCPYPVRSGDTVETIAARFQAAGVTEADIREVNGLTGNEIPSDRTFLCIPLSPASTK